MIRKLLFIPAAMMLLCSTLSATADGANAADHSHNPEFGVRGKLRGHGGSFVRFSPDGTLLMTAGEKDLQIWDAKTFAPVGQALTFPEEFVTAGFTAGGRVAYVAHSKGLWLWDPRTGKRIGPGITAPLPVYAAAVRPDGKRAAINWTVHSAAYSEPRIHLFDTSTGKEILPLPHESEVVFALFSPNGQRLLTMERVGRSGRFHIRDVSSGKDLFPPIETGCDRNCPPGDVSAPAVFTGDGRGFAVITSQSFAVFDSDTGQLLAGKAPRYEVGSSVDGLAISPDGKRITCVKSEDAGVYDAATGRPLGGGVHVPGTMYDFAVSPDATRLVCSYHVEVKGDQSATATGIWNLRTGQLFKSLDPIDGIATFNPSGDRIAVTGTGESKQDTAILDAATTTP